MKKTILLILIMMGSLSSYSYDYPYLIFQTISGDVQPVAVESLFLTISGGELIATNDTGTQRFTLSQLNKMYFSETETKIEDLKNNGNDIDGNYIVYDLSGRRISSSMSSSYSSSSICNIDISKGLYLVKKHDVTLKIVVK